MCIEFLGYPSYCLLVPKQCRLESRPVSLFQMSHLWMQSATWSHTCAVSSVEGTRCFFRAHFRRTSEVVMHAWGCVILFWTGNVCFWNGSDYTRPHLCVTVTLRAHVLVIVRVVSEWVVAVAAVVSQCTTFQSPYSYLPFASIRHPKSLLPLIPLLNFPLFPFLIIIFCVFSYLLLSLILNISLSHS